MFLGLQPGMTVIVRHDPMPGEPQDRDWWMGQVIHCEGGVRRHRKLDQRRHENWATLEPPLQHRLSR